MILLVPILLYIAVIVGLVYLSNRLLKNKSPEKRARNRRWIILPSIFLFPFLFFLYFSLLFGLSLENHYGVQRGSFLWYATMANETVTEFPIVEPMGDVTYNKNGAGGANSTQSWEIEYTSKKDLKSLRSTILVYLQSNGYKMTEVNETDYTWHGHKANKDKKLFSGVDKKGESYYLILHRRISGATRIKCEIVF